MKQAVLVKTLERRIENAYIIVGKEIPAGVWAKICEIVCPELYRAKKAQDPIQSRSHMKSLTERAKAGEELFHPDDSVPAPREPAKNEFKNATGKPTYFLIEELFDEN